ncbi:MAG: Hsp20/alpha crystallin family protein [Planctomycetia bacterium]|nr:Hsp20/alpha crystallin family protein [Planctomycetia bacterium]
MNSETTKQNGNAVANRPTETTRTTTFTPRVDIVEQADELLLFADLPGVKPEDLNLRFEKGELYLHGRCQPRGAQGKSVLTEYGVGDFHRVFSVSEEIDAEKIGAELKNGVLTVHLPKAEKVKPRQIAIKAV